MTSMTSSPTPTIASVLKVTMTLTYIWMMTLTLVHHVRTDVTSGFGLLMDAGSTSTKLKVYRWVSVDI